MRRPFLYVRIYCLKDRKKDKKDTSGKLGGSSTHTGEATDYVREKAYPPIII